MNPHPHRRATAGLTLWALAAALGAGLAGCDRGADETPAIPPASDRTVPPTPPEVPPPTGTAPAVPDPQPLPPATGAATDPVPGAAEPAASPASQ